MYTYMISTAIKQTSITAHRVCVYVYDCEDTIIAIFKDACCLSNCSSHAVQKVCRIYSSSNLECAFGEKVSRFCYYMAITSLPSAS